MPGRGFGIPQALDGPLQVALQFVGGGQGLLGSFLRIGELLIDAVEPFGHLAVCPLRLVGNRTRPFGGGMRIGLELGGALCLRHGRGGGGLRCAFRFHRGIARASASSIPSTVWRRSSSDPAAASSA